MKALSVEGCISRDPDEYIEIIKLTLDEAMELIEQGVIVDSKTIIAIQYYALNKDNL